MKGKIKEDHIPLNKFELVVVGLPTITVISITGLEEELAKVDLPDRTRRSGGQTMPVDFSITVPAHHHIEVAAIEMWYKQGQDPIDPAYLKAGSLIGYQGSGVPRPWSLINLWVNGRGIPGFEMSNDGEMAVLTYPMSTDDITPV